MNSTLSELFSSVYLGLGSPPDEVLQRIELANIVYRWLCYRLEAVRQSNQGEAIAKTATITLDADSDEVILTDEVDDFVIPMWVEMRGYNYLNNPSWIFVPTVNLSMLQERRNIGPLACSFYGENPLEVKVKFSYFGNELPGTPYRDFHVYYSPTVPLPTTEDANIGLPNNLVNILQYDAMVGALPLMIVNASKLIAKDPSMRDQIAAWTMLLQEVKGEQMRFEFLFNKWMKESRGSHRPSMRTDVLNTVLGGQGGGFPWAINNGGQN